MTTMPIARRVTPEVYWRAERASPGDVAETRVAIRDRGGPRRTRVRRRATCAPSGPRRCVDVSRPAATRARNAAPSAPPSGTAQTCTGRSVQSASAWTQSSTRVPPPVATMRRAGTGAASIMRRVTNPAASNAARRTDAASCVRSRSTSCRGVRSPGTAPARPAGTAPTPGHAPGSAARRDASAEHAVDPVEEQAAGVARAADEELAGRGVRDRVVVRDLDRARARPPRR